MGDPSRHVEGCAACRAVQRYVTDVLGRGDVGAISELFRADYRDHTAPPGSSPGVQGVHQMLADLGEGLDHTAFHIERLFCDGDTVAYRVYATGTRSSWTRAGVLRPGVVVGQVVGMFRIEDGLLCEHWGRWALEQM
ncbi:MAG TPA: nuclear transport factor 2 family protein [Iamia sp.]